MKTQGEHIRALRRRVDFLAARNHKNSYDQAELGALEWALVNLPPAQPEQESVAIEYWLQHTTESGRWVKTDGMTKATAERMLSGEYGDAFPQGRIVELPPPPQRTEHGVEYYRAEQVDALLAEQPAQPEHHKLQAKGEHPAPCARHCEAPAFQIVIKNLKAQFAQPAQQQEQEPIATLLLQSKQTYERNFGPSAAADWIYSDLHELLNTTPTLPVQERAAQQKEKEPYGYVSVCGVFFQKERPEIGRWETVYTTPPQRKPLTDERMWELWISQGDDAMEQQAAIAFARAIEAAHGIKEQLWIKKF
jgi:hypothetical protein